MIPSAELPGIVLAAHRPIKTEVCPWVIWSVIVGGSTTFVILGAVLVILSAGI